MKNHVTIGLAMGLSTAAGIVGGATIVGVINHGFSRNAIALFIIAIGLNVAAAETGRRAIREPSDAGDVYILVDRFPDSGDAADAIVSVHARRQGADLWANEYARFRGPLDYPGTGSDQKSIDKFYGQLAIVNRDVHDDE